jgi:glycine cleavage system H protein
MLRIASVAARVTTRVVPRRLASTTVFTKEHEYARIDGKVATCGITDFAQSQLGDVVYVSLPKKGDVFKKGWAPPQGPSKLRPTFSFHRPLRRTAMASVESVKAASDVYAPLSGTVTEVNGALADTPGLVNESAESNAWFVKLELSEPGEAASMLQPSAYKALCDAEKH